MSENSLSLGSVTRYSTESNSFKSFVEFSSVLHMFDLLINKGVGFEVEGFLCCFCQDMNWDDLLARKVRPPFVPNVVSIEELKQRRRCQTRHKFVYLTLKSSGLARYVCTFFISRLSSYQRREMTCFVVVRKT